MELLTTREAMGSWSQAQAQAGLGVALVPTMGMLHQGHLALVREARRHCQRVVVSIFVNPTQFGPNEDFARYPRDAEGDWRLLEAAGCDALFRPSVADIYPSDFATSVRVPDLAGELCGALRPGHFDGVATVVLLLLLVSRCQVACFGLKDYQQFVLIRRMVADLGVPVHLVGVPTVREPDGLALSSRNRYLTPPQRQVAPALYAALQAAWQAWQQGETSAAVLESLARERLRQDGLERIDYLSVRHRRTLRPVVRADEESVLLAAVHLGQARLIDNLPFSALAD
ncbi:MAG: pantoate--beta-alanine ligase [Magnetococcus sp. WYHC-3]